MRVWRDARLCTCRHVLARCKHHAVGKTNCTHALNTQPHPTRFLFKKAHMSREDFRVFDYNTGTPVAVMHHFGKVWCCVVVLVEWGVSVYVLCVDSALSRFDEREIAHHHHAALPPLRRHE